MPCLEISVPKLDQNKKEILAAKLTKVMAETTQLPIEIFGIRFFEYDVGESSNAGKLWDGKNGKPYHHFKLYICRLKAEIKKKLIAVLTDTYIEIIGDLNWKPVIFIIETPYENIGVEGKPLSERD